MERSKEICDKKGVLPALKLAYKKGTTVTGTGPHTVKVIEDKVVMGSDFVTGEERKEVKFIFEENGEKKFYRVPMLDKQGEVHYFVQRFAEIEPGTELTLEYTRKGLKGFIKITVPGQEEEAGEEEVPTIDAETNEKLPTDSAKTDEAENKDEGPGAE